MRRLATVALGRSLWPRAAWIAAPVLFLACALAVPAARASVPLPATVRPWLPRNPDSLTVWASRARGEFRANTGDTVGGDNYAAYEVVAQIAGSMIESLGQERMRQAYAIEPELKALGLAVELRLDPRQPGFALVMVHNPYRPSAAAVGFLYWWTGDRLRTQGAYFRWGRDPRFRVWWTGDGQSPYWAGIVDHAADPGETLGFLLLRMGHDGSHWDLVQYPGQGPEIAASGEADWEDVNGDGLPELVAWLHAPSDPAFRECTGCPPLLIERVFTFHPDGFELEDSRLVPTPYATFQRFIRYLADDDRVAAERLVTRSSMVDSALAEGWARDLRPGTWLLDRVEGGEQWPRWLSLERELRGRRAIYAVHFAHEDGRWVVSHWYRERYFGPDSTLRAIYAADSAATKPARAKGGSPRGTKP